MKVYELARNGKRSKYRTLELALTAAVKGDSIYEIEFDGSREMGLCDFWKGKRKSERLVFAK